MNDINISLSVRKRTSGVNAKTHILKTLRQNSDFRECCVKQLPPQAEYVHSTNAEILYFGWTPTTGGTKQ